MRVGEELVEPKPYRQVRAHFDRFEADLGVDDEGVEFDRGPFLNVLRRYLDRCGLGVEWDVVTAAPAPALINSLCMALPFAPVEKQALLEAPDMDERRAALATLMEIAAAALSHDDDDDAKPFLQ